MVAKKSKVCSGQSTIPGIGNGLFAIVPIEKGSIIAEFKGKLRNPGEKLTSDRSNIYFNDEHILECNPSDLASFANDAIKFPETRRQLMTSLRSDEPFYKLNPNCSINSSIKLNDKLHRAFLIATRNIKQGEEIFNHYGFSYWFSTEITKLGFSKEEEIEQNGFPSMIFEYPGFLNYVRLVYPEYASHEIKQYKGGYDFIVTYKTGKNLLIHLEDYSNKISVSKIGIPQI